MNDRTSTTVVSFLIIISYVIFVVLLFSGIARPNIPADLQWQAGTAFGVYTAMFVAAVLFHLGSSAGSRSKDALIAGQLPPPPQATVLPAPSPPISLPAPGPLPSPQAPKASPAPPMAPVANVLTFTGKESHFGGPEDTGVGPDEGLALCEPGEENKFPGLFLPSQPPGTTGLARRLDPSKHYIACRWNYKQTPRSWLQKTKVSAAANGITITDVQPIDWGPAESTGRVADLSPGLEAALRLTTDGTVTITVPLPPGSLPATSASPAATATGITKHVWPLQSEAAAFYGDPDSAGWEHANLVEVPCPWPLQIDGQTIHTISIHSKCAESLKEVLEAIWEACGRDLSKISALKYDRYDGSYNNRPMRGSTTKSMHAYGCAIDFDAADNPFHSDTHLFTADSIIVQKFEAAGWVWGGRWMSPDAMHYQASRVHP